MMGYGQGLSLVRDLPSRLIGWGQEGLWVGLAMTFAYAVEWLVIAATGRPSSLPVHAVVLWFQALLTAAALYQLVGRPRLLSDWRGLPMFTLLGFLWWATLWEGVNTWYHQPPLGAILFAAGVLWFLFGLLVLAPPLALYPVARSANLRGLWAWRLVWRVGPVRVVAWLVLGVLLLAAWQAVEAFAKVLVLAQVPYPSMAALMVGLLHAVGWAVVAAAGVGGLARRARAAASQATPGPVGTDETTGPSAPGAAGPEPAGRAGVGSELLRAWPGWRRYAVAGGYAVSLLFILSFSSNLANGSLFLDAVKEAQASKEASLVVRPLAAIDHGSRAIGEAQAGAGVAALMAGDRAAADRWIRQAMWWAPQSRLVLRAQAWVAVLGAVGPRPRTAILAVETSGDRAGTLQLMGIWQVHSGGDGRAFFFAASAEDPLVGLSMPPAVPEPAITGTHGQPDLAARIIDTQREVFGETVGFLDEAHAFAAAVASDDTIRGLMAGTPQKPLQPTYGEDLAAVHSLAVSGAYDLAQARLGDLFRRDTNSAHRQVVAAVCLNLASSATHPHPDNFDAIVKFAGSDGDTEASFSLALYDASMTDHKAAERILGELLLQPLDQQTRAQVLSAKAADEYVSSGYQNAIDDARRALALNVASVAPLDESVIGNAELALHPKDTQGETDLTRAAQDNPHAFMAWYSLGRLAAARGDAQLALTDYLKALTELELLSRLGIGRNEAVVSTPGNSGRFYAYGSDPYGLANFQTGIRQEIAALQKGTRP